MWMWAAPICSRAARFESASGTFGSCAIRYSTRASKRRKAKPINRPRWALRQRSTAWRWSVEVRHSAFFSSTGRTALDSLLSKYGIERVLLDTESLFSRPPLTDDGREEWEQKPRVPALHEALTDQPIVRFIGTDYPEVTAEGIANWQPVVADWLREGRTPTVFLHTPDNTGTPGLAHAFHAALSKLVPDVAPLPTPLPLVIHEQASLF